MYGVIILGRLTGFSRRRRLVREAQELMVAVASPMGVAGARAMTSRRRAAGFFVAMMSTLMHWKICLHLRVWCRVRGG